MELLEQRALLSIVWYGDFDTNNNYPSTTTNTVNGTPYSYTGDPPRNPGDNVIHNKPGYGSWSTGGSAGLGQFDDLWDVGRDYDNSGKPGWSYRPRVTSATDVVHQGSHSARVEVDPGDNTLKPTAGTTNADYEASWLFGPGPYNPYGKDVWSNLGHEQQGLHLAGEEQWWGWSVNFGNFAIENKAEDVFTQFHAGDIAAGKPYNPWDVNARFFVDNGSHFTDSVLAVSRSGSNDTTDFNDCQRYSLCALHPNQWYDIVYHVKWSSDNAVGFIEVWVNGTQYVSNSHPITYTDDNGVQHTNPSGMGRTLCRFANPSSADYAGAGGFTLGLFAGYYRQDYSSTAVVYFDNFRWATTQADVMNVGPAPTAPNLLSASAVSANQINLSWSDNSTNETGFNVDRAPNSTFTSGVTTFSVGSHSGTGTTTYADTGLSGNTTYYYRLRATNGAESANSNTASATTPTATQGPYGGTPWAVPGHIEAENYDIGGEGVAFHDGDGTNTGNDNFRTSGDNCDIFTTADTGGGAKISNESAGDWYEYTVNLTPAVYTISLRLANPGDNAQVRVRMDGNDITGLVTVPNTGGYDVFQTVAVSNVNLSGYSSGSHVARIEFATAGSNGYCGSLNWFEFATSGVTAPTSPTSLAASAVSGSQVNLSWTDNSTNETAFELDRATNSTFTSGLTTLSVGSHSGTGTSTYSDVGLTGSTTFYYRVRATIGGGNDSTNSNTASATTGAGGATTSLYAYYSLDGNTNDSTGSYSGTAIGTPTYTTAVIGSGITNLLYGTGFQGITVPTSFMSGGKGVASISLWYYNTSSGAGDAGGFTPLALRVNSASGSNGMQLSEHGGYTNNPNNFYFKNSGNGFDVDRHSTSTTAQNSAAWHQLVYTWNVGASAAIYQDGVLVGSMTGSNAVSGNGTYGAWATAQIASMIVNSGHTTSPVGVDDYAVFNNVLADAQVKAIYDLGNQAALKKGADVANALFQFYETAAQGATTTIGGQTWQKYGTGNTYNGTGAFVGSQLQLGTASGVQLATSGRLIVTTATTVSGADMTAVLSGSGADVQHSKLLLDYTGESSPANTVNNLMLSSYHMAGPNHFDVGQLQSSTADATHGLGWIDDMANSQVEIAYTVYGDADLNGIVGASDLGKVLVNWGVGTKWGDGDVDYDAFVGASDLGKVLVNWGQSVGTLTAAAGVLTSTFAEPVAPLHAVEPQSVPVGDVAVNAKALTMAADLPTATAQNPTTVEMPHTRLIDHGVMPPVQRRNIAPARNIDFAQWALHTNAEAYRPLTLPSELVSLYLPPIQFANSATGRNTIFAAPTVHSERSVWHGKLVDLPVWPEVGDIVLGSQESNHSWEDLGSPLDLDWVWEAMMRRHLET